MSDEMNQVRSFLEKHRTAKIANSREIRLTMQDADILAASIAVMLARESEMAAKIIDLQSQILSAEIKQDGGSF
jgi:hypothetical protein